MNSLRDSTALDGDDGELSPGTVVANKYRIDAMLGVGGMGAVYAATNVHTSKKLALKWMLPSFARDGLAVARFMREARAVGSIDHPNVVNVFDVGQEGETPFLVMELLRGSSLADRLDEGPVDAATLVEILIPAMRGIHAAHTVGLVHRDLKPANIFVCTDGKGRLRTAKVLDFGISKAVDGTGELESITRSGAVIGTPQYMSPEQIRGVELDARADVYALGVILYEALTGHLPFSAKTFTALAVEIATGWLRPPSMFKPELDRKLETVVMRALARERDVRFADVESLARALEPFGRGAKFDDDEAPTRGSEDGMAIPQIEAALSDLATASTVAAPAPSQEIPAAGAPTPPRSRAMVLVPLIAIFAIFAITMAWVAFQPETSEPRAAPEPAPAAPPDPAEETAQAPSEPSEPSLEATAPTEAPVAEAPPPAPVRTPRRVRQPARTEAPSEPATREFRTQSIAEDEF